MSIAEPSESLLDADKQRRIINIVYSWRVAKLPAFTTMPRRAFRGVRRRQRELGECLCIDKYPFAYTTRVRAQSRLCDVSGSFIIGYIYDSRLECCRSTCSCVFRENTRFGLTDSLSVPRPQSLHQTPAYVGYFGWRQQPFMCFWCAECATYRG